MRIDVGLAAVVAAMLAAAATIWKARGTDEESYERGRRADAETFKRLREEIDLAVRASTRCQQELDEFRNEALARELKLRKELSVERSLRMELEVKVSKMTTRMLAHGLAGED